MNKIFLIILVFSLAACSVRKHSKVTATQGSELALVSEKSAKSSKSEVQSSTVIRDTIITVKERVVTQILEASALKPVFDEKGKALPNKSYIRGRGVSVELTALPSGQIQVVGSCDSIELLIKGLIEERSVLKLKKDSLSNAVAVLKTEDSATKISTKTSSSILPWWAWAALTIAGALVMAKFIFKFKFW